MNTLFQLSQDYARIEQAIRYIEIHAKMQPDLQDVAAEVGLSEYHFQRLFTRWAGISPKRFLQFLTRENAKVMLTRSENILDTAFAAGLSSPGRLHDLFVQTEAVTPGEYKNRGLGINISFGFHPSPFGEGLLALTGRGICFLAFVDGNRQNAFNVLRQNWPNANLIEDSFRTAAVMERIFSTIQEGFTDPLSLHLHGTNFQIKVWEALLRLQSGQVTSYQGLANLLHSPNSARAVGNAVAQNPIAFLIPCHRVLQKTGYFGNYRYGSIRKKAILAWEYAQAKSA
jgi:AraC family transcriptional regulator of adaptative response/methylated-DNA-[protein]-cysteine methyltransferase